ncbi:hypothetical protein, partial [Nocardia cyriacigeorgica]|uniref:hypothetical protein n=1 Tax=Nocardia cyriacigeorgica TaxID=135487 RepID=UPI0024553F7F
MVDKAETPAVLLDSTGVAEYAGVGCAAAWPVLSWFGFSRVNRGIVGAGYAFIVYTAARYRRCRRWWVRS